MAHGSPLQRTYAVLKCLMKMISIRYKYQFILHWPTFRKEAWQKIKNVMPVKTTVRSRGSLIIHDLGHVFFLSSLRGEKHPVNIWAVNISWALYCSSTPALSEHVSGRLKNNIVFFLTSIFPTLFFPYLYTFLLPNPLSQLFFSLSPCLYIAFANSNSKKHNHLELITAYIMTQRLVIWTVAH